MSRTEGEQDKLERPTTQLQRPPSTEKQPPALLQNPPEEADSDDDEDWDDAGVEEDTGQYAGIHKLIASIIQALGKHGTIVKVRGVQYGIRGDNKRKKSWFISAACFVEFALKHEALAAVKALNETQVAGHHLKVEYAGYSGCPSGPVVARLKTRCWNPGLMAGRRQGELDEDTLKTILGPKRALTELSVLGPREYVPANEA